MDCKQVHPSLSAYLDGELSADEQMAVSGHLAHCEQCMRQMKALEKNDTFLKTIGSITASAGLSARVLSRLKEQREVQRRADRWTLRWIPVPLAGAALLMLFSLFIVALPFLNASAGVKGKAVDIALQTLCGLSEKSVLAPVNFSAFCGRCEEMLCEGCSACEDGECSMDHNREGGIHD